MDQNNSIEDYHPDKHKNVVLSEEDIDKYAQKVSENLYQIIDTERRQVAVYVNQRLTLMHWRTGKFLRESLDKQWADKYGQKIVATVSRLLTLRYGRGYTAKSLWKMMQVAAAYPDEQIVVTLSRQLTWSHFLELQSIDNPTKRLYYQQMAILHHWSVRDMRKREDDEMEYERMLIAAKPEEEQVERLQQVTLSPESIDPDLVFKSSYVVDFLGLQGRFSEKELEDAIVAQLERFIMELGNDFAFLERQKRFTVDGEDYYLDLLFYHRGLQRLIAIDLKLGRFKPQYKAQMELYLNYMQRYELRPGEKKPWGLLLCQEGNTEHLELLMMGDEDIKVAQYLTQLPPKQWFLDKLQRSIAIAAEWREEE